MIKNWTRSYVATCSLRRRGVGFVPTHAISRRALLRLRVCGLFRCAFNVVPAKAGTYTPRPLGCRMMVDGLRFEERHVVMGPDLRHDDAGAFREPDQSSPRATSAPSWNIAGDLPDVSNVVARSRRPATARLLCMGLFSIFLLRGCVGLAAGLPSRRSWPPSPRSTSDKVSLGICLTRASRLCFDIT